MAGEKLYEIITITNKLDTKVNCRSFILVPFLFQILEKICSIA